MHSLLPVTYDAAMQEIHASRNEIAKMRKELAAAQSSDKHTLDTLIAVNAELNQECVSWARTVERMVEREDYAELERKLAGQQAVCLEWIPEKLYDKAAMRELTALLTAEYQRGRAEERAEAEKEKPFDADNPKFMEALLDTLRGINLPVTRKGLGFRSPYTQGCLEVSFEVVNRLNLYTRPLAAQNPLSEESIYGVIGSNPPNGLIGFARAIEAAHGITENKEG